MSTSWRIETNIGDKTQITRTSSEIIGAMVIDSYKGDKDFVLIDKGDTQKVLDVFGYPSQDYPTIQDALDSVTKSTMWIASPYKNDGLYGGVFVTPNGTHSFVNGVSTKSIEDLSSIDCSEIVGIGNGVVVAFEKQLENADKIAKNSIKIYEGEVDLGISIDESGNITDTDSKLTDDSTYIDGLLKLKFNVAPTTTIKIEYTKDESDCNFILFDKNPQTDDLRVKVIKSEKIDEAFEIYVSRFNPSTDNWDDVKNSPFIVGLSEDSKDNNGNNIYIGKVFGDNQYLFTPYVNNSVVESFTNDVNEIPLKGGNRGGRIQGSDIANKYNDLKNTNKFILKAVVDSTCSSECIPVFEALRNEYHKRCRFLCCTKDVEASEIIATPTEFNGGITNNRGMYCYTLNWGVHKDVYRGNDFNCSNMGLIYGRLVDVLTVGGGVPAWIDEDGVGGILGGSITKLNRFASETELRRLDDLCFNPVIMDNTYGAMIVSWKTRQVKETVFSYIGQSSLTDTIIELVEKNVLPTRIAKLIDSTTYSVVQNGCDTIMKRYSKWLEDWLIVCDDRNNDGESKNAQELHLTIGVIFKGYASRIIFNFTADRNGVKLEESILQ